MGIGRYKNGKFDLILSIRHNADTTRIQQWERSFRRASEILYDSTDGQMQFGKLYVANNSAGTDEADAHLMDPEGTSFATGAGVLGTPGQHMELKSDEKNKPFIIAHEFAHYGLGVYDEYSGPGGSAECTGDPAGDACILESGYWDGDQIDDSGVLTVGRVSEFCTADNHDPDNDTYQESLNSEACWDTIKSLYPTVTVPTGMPDAPVPAGHEPVDWILLNSTPRFALVLDRSGSMSASNAIEGVRYGADYWINFLAQTSDELSIVAYNHGQDVILPLSLVSSIPDLTPTLTAIGGITPTGNTNIGGALQEGSDQIMSLGDQAATQVVVLFSDGLHNTGMPPEDVLEGVIDSGIRVYTVGFGPGADQLRLQQIAEDTGGRFEQIDEDPGIPDAELEIRNYLIEISGEVRDGSGIVTMAPAMLPEPERNERAGLLENIRLRYTNDDLKTIKKIPYSFRPSFGGFDHRAYIEDGSRRAIFIVSYKLGTVVQFYLVRPDGSVVDPSTDQNVVFVNLTRSPYALYVVDSPDPGFWTMRVRRGQASGTIPFKVFAFSENPSIFTSVHGAQSVINVGDSVHLTAQASFISPLTHLRPITARVLPGDWVSQRGPLKRLPSVRLRERFLRIDSKGQPCQDPSKLGNGSYEGQLKFDNPGSYTVEIVLANSGEAKHALPITEKTRPGEKEARLPEPPVFIRTRRFQVHVGPLPTGKDVETRTSTDRDGKDECCNILDELRKKLQC